MRSLILAIVVIALSAIGRTQTVTHDPWTGDMHARYAWSECSVAYTLDMHSTWDTRVEDTLHFRGLLYSTLRWTGDICSGYTSNEPGQGETVGTLPWIPGSLPGDALERSPLSRPH